MKLTTFTLSALAAPLALALPAELDTRQTQSRVQINPLLYPVLRRYTELAAASSATFALNGGRCPNPPSNTTLVRTINRVTTNTQVAIFRDSVTRELIVSFSGTTGVQDLITNLLFVPVVQSTATNCNGCRVHAGFYAAWRSVADELATALADLRAQNPGFSTTLTGYGLGGALASLAYTDLKADGVPVGIAYTFGSPRVGNQAYADYTDRLSGASNLLTGTFIRVTHRADGVPSAPPAALGFRHSRTEIFEDDNRNGDQSAQTTYRCFGQEARDCNAGSARGLINDDHLEYTGVDMTNLSKDQCKNT